MVLRCFSSAQLSCFSVYVPQLRPLMNPNLVHMIIVADPDELRLIFLTKLVS